MFRTNRLAAAILAGIIFIFAGTETSQSYALNEDYVTTVVTRQDMSVTVTVDVGINFLDNEDIIFDSIYENASFVKYLVERGQEVTEGQDLVEIQYNVDPIALAQLEIELRKAEESYNSYILSRDSELSELANAIDEAPDDTGREIAHLRLEKKQMEYGKEDISRLEYVESVRTKVNNAKNAVTVTTIKSPADGVVGWLQRMNSGDTIYDGSYFGTIVKLGSDNVIFTLSDPNSIMRYGMEVTLADASGNEYPAHVVSSSNAGLSDSMKAQTAYIVADENIPVSVLWSFKMSVTYETIHLEDVVIIPKSALNKDKYGNYVREITGNTIVKRYVTLGREIKDRCFIADGLTEGTTIIVE